MVPNDEILLDVDWSGVEHSAEITARATSATVATPPPIPKRSESPVALPVSIPPARDTQPFASSVAQPVAPSPPAPYPQVDSRPPEPTSNACVRMVRGQRIDLLQLGLKAKPFEIGLKIPTGIQLDIAALALGSNEKILDERYVIFFNQPLSPCGAIRVASQREAGCSVLVDLAALPPQISRVVIAVAIDGATRLPATGEFVVEIADSGRLAATHSASCAELGANNGLILAELYERQGTWRLFMRSEGFDGGLDWLFRHYGIVLT